MIFKRNKIEVVQPREYSNHDTLAYLGGRYKEASNKRNKTANKDLTISALFGGVVGSLQFNNIVNAAPTTGEWALQTAQPNVIPTGVIADASLTALATVLDPIVELLVAISFPIASVIVVCAFFLIMIGNKEKAFDMMMHAGLGYILIQLSPMFLEILKQVGEAL